MDLTFSGVHWKSIYESVAFGFWHISNHIPPGPQWHFYLWKRDWQFLISHLLLQTTRPMLFLRGCWQPRTNFWWVQWAAGKLGQFHSEMPAGCWIHTSVPYWIPWPGWLMLVRSCQILEAKLSMMGSHWCLDGRWARKSRFAAQKQAMANHLCLSLLSWKPYRIAIIWLPFDSVFQKQNCNYLLK